MERIQFKVGALLQLQAHFISAPRRHCCGVLPHRAEQHRSPEVAAEAIGRRKREREKESEVEEGRQVERAKKVRRPVRCDDTDRK